MYSLDSVLKIKANWGKLEMLTIFMHVNDYCFQLSDSLNLKLYWYPVDLIQHWEIPWEVLDSHLWDMHG